MACVVTGALAATDAEARPSQDFDLQWQAPPQCPGLPEITAQIQSILESAPGTSLPSGLAASGEIEPLGDRYRLTLKVRVGENEYARVITADDCSSLGKATAVVLSLLIRRANDSGRAVNESDLGGSFAPAPRAPAEPRQPTSPPAREPRKSPAGLPAKTTASSAEPEGLRLVVSAPILTVDYFALPKTAVGLGGSAGAYYRGWRGLVSGLLWSEQRLARAGLEPYEARFSRSSLELWGCRGWRTGDWELSPCALLSLDVVRASASGDRLASQNGTKALLWGGAGLMGLWHLSRPVRLFVSASGRFSAVRTDFSVVGLGGTQNAHSVPLATVATSLGTEFLF